MASAIGIVILSCHPDSSKTRAIDFASATEAKFVGAGACLSCHEKEYASWQGSHHKQAMQVADSGSVLADFNNIEVTSNNVKHTFYMKGEEYYVHTQGGDGSYRDFKIEYTFGVYPLQQYIVGFPDGKWQCLQTAWDSEKNRWFDLQPELDIQPDEWIHWTGGGMRWNSTCADCHSTNLQKNFDVHSNTYNTTFSEINVACEACHGPASMHVDYYQSPEKGARPPPLYMDSTMTSFELVDKCARCHSRRQQITKVFDYSGSFMDHYAPTLLIDPIYEADGQIRDEVYVYGSFIQSKMFHNGVSCVDCHDAHSLKLKQTGNALCLSCHEPNYGEFSHHFHDVTSEGAQCINCHMTGKTYMGNDFRRDHSFRIPRPDQTVNYGTPNACNECHTDKSPEWASQFINVKYGNDRDDHFSDLLLAGFNGDQAAYFRLASQKKYPDIARATALNLYSNQQLSLLELSEIKDFLKDPSTLIRTEAVHAFEKSGRPDYAEAIEPLLLDSVRMVRIAAARYFNTVDFAPLDLARAEKEYLELLEMNADFASGQHEIAEYHHMKGNVNLAIKAYQKAIELDNHFNSSRLNLALLLYQQGDVGASEELYLKVIEQEPDFSHSYYMLGLLYHETGNSSKALEYLGLACDREPINTRAFYNYALKLQEAGEFQASITIIDRALEIVPGAEEFLYVKLLAYLRTNQHDAARELCRRLIEIAPNNNNYRQILEQINSNAG